MPNSSVIVMQEDCSRVCHSANSETTTCLNCFGVSIACAIMGFVLGIISQKLDAFTGLSLTSNRSGNETVNQELSTSGFVKGFSCESPGHTFTVADEEDNRCRDTLLVQQSDPLRELGSNSITVSSKSALVQRGADFASSIRKLSGLSGLQHGLIEARGKELEILTLDRTMRQLLGCRDSASVVSGREILPTSVHDFLPNELRNSHRKFLSKAIEDGALPSSLMHPMRNVPMLRCDGSIMRVDICVGIITKVLPRPISFSPRASLLIRPVPNCGRSR
jgi:hypothetical protein